MSNSNYMVDGSSADTIDNLYKLIMSASVKDTDAIHAVETDLSKFLEETLLMYYDNKTPQEDIVKLLKFVNKFNIELNKYLYQHFYSKIFGLDTNISDSSLINIIATKLMKEDTDGDGDIDKQYNKDKLIRDIIYYGFNYIKDNIAIQKDQVKKVIKTLDSGEIVVDTERDFKLFNILPDPGVGGELELWELDDEEDETKITFTISYIEKKEDKDITHVIYTGVIPKNDMSRDDIKERVEKIIDIGKGRQSPLFIKYQSHLIHIFPIFVDGDVEKVSASEKEIQLSTGMFPYSFIEIHNADISEIINDTSTDYSFLRDIIHEENIKTDENKKNTSFVIVYKELNEKYREYCYSTYADILYSYNVNMNADNTATPEPLFIAPSKYFNTSLSDMSCCITNNIKTIIETKYEDDNNYNYFKDTVYEVMNNVHTNPYIAVSSPESAIIQYFAGNSDTYSNGYGDRKSEREEIQLFLDTYEHVREFWYSTLSGKAFTNGEYYKSFERMMITTFAIMKTLDNKMDNLKDIDKLNGEDIDNFLESYGLGIVTKYGAFANEDEYKRRLLKYYNELMKAKGSKEVIDILSNVFDIGNTDVDIKKYDLVCDTGTAELAINEQSIGLIMFNGYDNEFNDGVLDIVYTANDFVLDNDSGNYVAKQYDKKLAYYKDTNKGIVYFADATDKTSTSIKSIIDNHIFRLTLDDNMTKQENMIALANNIIDTIISVKHGPYAVDRVEDNADAVHIKKVIAPNNEYGFVRLDYASDDEFGAILSAISEKSNYDVFIANDKYWDSDRASLDDIEKLNICATPTKYLSLDMTKDIDYTFIKATYMLSAVRLIYEKMKENDIYKNIYLELEIDDVGSRNLQISTIFEICLILYNVLCNAYRSLHDNKSYNPPDENEKAYGINRNITGNNIDYIIEELFKKMHLPKDKGVSSLISSEGVLYIDSDVLYDDEDIGVKNNTTEDLLDYIRNDRFAELAVSTLSKKSTKAHNSGQFVIDTISEMSAIYSLVKGSFIKYLYRKIRGLNEEGSKNKELTVDDFIVAIDNMIRFPITYLNGSISYNKNNDYNVSKDFMDLCDDIFNKVYTTAANGYGVNNAMYILPYADTVELKADTWSFISDDNISLDDNIIKYMFSDMYAIDPIPNGNGDDDDVIKLTKRNVTTLTETEAADLIVSISEKLFTVLNSLKTLFRSSAFCDWSFTNIEASKDEFKFLQAAVEIFISYTTNLYNMTLNRTYDSKFENIIPVDQFKFKNITIDLVDNVVIDDEFV